MPRKGLTTVSSEPREDRAIQVEVTLPVRRGRHESDKCGRPEFGLAPKKLPADSSNHPADGPRHQVPRDARPWGSPELRRSRETRVCLQGTRDADYEPSSARAGRPDLPDRLRRCSAFSVCDHREGFPQGFADCQLG